MGGRRDRRTRPSRGRRSRSGRRQELRPYGPELPDQRRRPRAEHDPERPDSGWHHRDRRPGGRRAGPDDSCGRRRQSGAHEGLGHRLRHLVAGIDRHGRHDLPGAVRYAQRVHEPGAQPRARECGGRRARVHQPVGAESPDRERRPLAQSRTGRQSGPRLPDARLHRGNQAGPDLYGRLRRRPVGATATAPTCSRRSVRSTRRAR